MDIIAIKAELIYFNMRKKDNKIFIISLYEINIAIEEKEL